MFTIADPAVTLVSSFTKAAVTSSTVPLMVIASEALTVPVVDPPIADKFVAKIGVVAVAKALSVIVIAILLSLPLTPAEIAPK